MHMNHETCPPCSKIMLLNSTHVASEVNQNHLATLISTHLGLAALISMHQAVLISTHLARSSVMKQANPLRARLASYWLWVEMSFRIMLVVSMTTSTPSWKH